jgi:glutaconate CoA-transferase subunit A
MPEVELLATGEGDYRLHDPDSLRAWMRDRKRRDFVDKTTTAAEAMGRLVSDGDYVSFDFSSFTRGPLVLIREIIRQRRRHLWYCAKFTLDGVHAPRGRGSVLEDRRGLHGTR